MGTDLLGDRLKDLSTLLHWPDQSQTFLKGAPGCWFDNTHF